MTDKKEHQSHVSHAAATLNPRHFPYRYGLAFGFFEGVVWLIASATPLVLLLQQLGGTPFQVGLAYSFGYLMLPLQVVATAFIRHVGYKKQVLFSWGIRTVFLFIPITLALMATFPVSKWMSHFMVWSFFLFALFRTFGHSAWFPWLYHLLPKSTRGRYFAFDQTLMNLAGVLVLICSSGFFYIFSVFNAFAIIYGVAVLASVAAILSVVKLPSLETRENIKIKDVWSGTLRLCLKRGTFRSYLFLSLGWFLVGTPYVPFTIYYLNENLHVSDGTIVFYTGIQYLGSIITAWLVRSLLDNYGVRPFFVLSLISCVFVKVYWLFLVLGYGVLVKWISIVFLINGISTVLWQMSHLKYMPQLTSIEDRALGVALQTAIVGVAGGIAPILWGFVLNREGSINSLAFIIYFIITIIVLVCLIYPYSRVYEEHPERPPLSVAGAFVRPFRFITKLVYFIDKER